MGKNKNHGKKYKAKKQDKVFLDPNLVIKPSRLIKFYGIGIKEKTFPRNQITIEKI